MWAQKKVDFALDRKGLGTGSKIQGAENGGHSCEGRQENYRVKLNGKKWKN